MVNDEPGALGSAEIDPRWLDDLGELLAIPSVSADPACRADVVRAGEWVCEFIRGAGGAAELADWNGQPLALGELRASSGAGDAPTVLLYGHFDVQPADPLELWTSPPFEATARDGWLYARGAADDKGQLYMLLRAAADLAAAGELPVDVRFTCDGEEETIGTSLVEWLATDERGADAAIVFDSGYHRAGVPVFNVATRGLCYFHVRVSTGDRDLHSGVYGGAALNAAHVLLETLSALLPRDGRLPEALRAGSSEPAERELADWALLTPGSELLEAQGARAADSAAAERFYHRTWAEPAVDVHGLASGSPELQKTIVPASAEANVSVRLAPGQNVEQIAGAAERLLRAGAPDGASVEIVRLASSAPGLIDPESPAVQIGLEAFERALGVRPLLVRGGGTLPIVPALAAKGIPTILTGFDLPDGNAHSPNERLALAQLPLGIAAARQTLLGLAQLR